MINTLSTYKVPYVLMHMQGIPQNMQKNPYYKNANPNSVFKDKYNCFVVKDEKDLVKLLKKWPGVTKIRNNAKKLLQPHIDVSW